MNRRQFNKYATYSIAVLTATLINQLVVEYIKSFIHEKGYLLVLIDMLVIILVFAPIFTLVSKYTKKISAGYVKTSKHLSKKGNNALVGFIIAFIILFVLFALKRHHLDVIAELRMRFGI